jgi:Trk K+ transport system NAD-binding subunit
MKRNRVIAIGVGKIGADLLQKLSKDYDLVCIDNAPESVDHVKKLWGDGTVRMQADATSQA